MPSPRPQVWAPLSASMLRAHELDWQGPLRGEAIMPSSVKWVSEPAGLTFSNLQVVGTHTLVDIGAPANQSTITYLIRCQLTDSLGLIHETEPPIEMKVTPGALVRAGAGGGYSGEVFIGNPRINAPLLVKSVATYLPIVTTPKTPKSIAQSLQFVGANAPVLTKTFAGAPDDATRSTISLWFRRNGGPVATRRGMTFLYGGADQSNNTALFLDTGDIFAFSEGKIRLEHLDSGARTAGLFTTFQLRDAGAWYHLVVVVDTNLADVNDRVKFWMNGRAVTDKQLVATTPLGKTLDWLDASPGSIGQGLTDFHNPHQLDSNLAELHAVDGLALTATDFGTFDADGVWGPVSYVGSHGSNGFYLDFSDTANFGKDAAGTNDWSASNLVAGDQVLDVPDDVFPVLERSSGASAVLGGGTIHDATDAGRHNALATVGLTAGKWYWEVTFDAQPDRIIAGLFEFSYGEVEIGPLGTSLNPDILGGYCIAATGTFYANRDGGTASGLPAFVAGDVCQFAYDASSGKLWVGRNGTFIGDPGADTGQIAIVVAANGIQRAATPWSQVSATSAGVVTGQATYNFGAKGIASFAYSPPSGFLPISTDSMAAADYAPIPNGAAGHDSILYTGNGTAQSFSGFQFAPDLLWVKQRNLAAAHQLVDSARGDNNHLSINLADVEIAQAQGIALDLAGFTVGSLVSVNDLNDTYVGWAFKKGPQFGIDIIQYTGDGVAGRTLPHSLGARPDLVLVKNLDLAGDWQMLWMHWLDAVIVSGRNVWEPKPNPEQWSTPMNNPTNKIQSVVYWNDTAPDASVVTLGNWWNVNGAGNRMLAYLFRSIPGFSRVSAMKKPGGLPWCGFRPRFIMERRMSLATGASDLLDTTLLGATDTMGRVNYDGGFGATRSRSLEASSDLGENLDDMTVSSRAYSGGGNAASAAFSFLAFAEFPTIKSRGY